MTKEKPYKVEVNVNDKLGESTAEEIITQLTIEMLQNELTRESILMKSLKAPPLTKFQKLKRKINRIDRKIRNYFYILGLAIIGRQPHD